MPLETCVWKVTIKHHFSSWWRITCVMLSLPGINWRTRFFQSSGNISLHLRSCFFGFSSWGGFGFTRKIFTEETWALGSLNLQWWWMCRLCTSSDDWICKEFQNWQNLNRRRRRQKSFNKKTSLHRSRLWISHPFSCRAADIKFSNWANWKFVFCTNILATVQKVELVSVIW